MALVSFQYGGARGKKHRLIDSNEHLVVRTRARDVLANTPLSENAHKSIDAWHTVLHFEDAGVEVLQSSEKSRRTARRDAARARKVKILGRAVDPLERRPSGLSEDRNLGRLPVRIELQETGFLL